MKPKTPIQPYSQSVEYPSKKSKQDDAGGRVFLDGGLKAGTDIKIPQRGGLFLWFVSFGQAKEMNKHS
ncbi:hypothetical protein [Ulvibacter litoralis]|uniref:Uncharacterized protein n=1 Tax=Ulvibacter litoralis TaxID=227084 RepID=A0A1G7JTR7_9FLAO|nr:hypothetical protein [Ulvibacter litoralis]SDF28271.1 hypothetical protein SAMN05421855_1294 [Ulvibacter litoralis]